MKFRRSVGSFVDVVLTKIGFLKEGVPVQGEGFFWEAYRVCWGTLGKVRESEKTIERIRYPPHLNPPTHKNLEKHLYEISKFTW